ncbi:hypothetical protein SAMN05444007_104139 [Cribrihabitans marinus]|uniref:DUF2125 domain-containing protein n=1 Tax=Cribrihabitans marinus TaxID=1227549 RepID=A0A1H6Y1G3_9RHOB|nr:DUF2125 domain-containing protein [Cribrihabitans marinus]GGH27801.1 hypothetical protein GCM10010973_16320 [Cribrihabitans marinus]SEJ30952.1 hypothetical protein SAMN05444007_104139 [Cribrihabitans marinus]
MKHFYRRTCSAAMACAFASTGAWAELTAQDVWADWEAYMGGMGYDLTGSETTSGNVTTITDMSMSMDLPEGEGAIMLAIPEMTLTENGDGTVSIGFPEEFPMTFEVTPTDDAPVRGEFVYTQQQMDMVVSGSPDDMTYDYSAQTIGFDLVSLEAEGEEMPEGTLTLGFDLAGVTGTSNMKIGDARDITQSMAADTLTYDVAFDDPESDEGIVMNGEMTGLGFTGDGTIPKDFNAGDYQSMVDAGFAYSGGFTYATGQTKASGNPDEQPFSFESNSEGGDFQVAMNGDHIVYDITQKAPQMTIVSSEMPFPIEIAMAVAGMKFDIPVQAKDEAQPFAFAVNLTDFTMSDILWSMFDPAGALPRDPATVKLDATGMAKVLVNFLDPEVASTLEATDAAPGELQSLKINELLVSMVGARLSGTGDFEFDNSDLETYDGMPAPSGEANLQLVGANALIDKLIGMGLMAEQDAMGARMMMGMLAVPGDAPDTLNSKIEVTKDGQILANGQRIK